MAVELWIDDGDPWYMSPDIWIVPGANPSGPAGTPTAGQQSYVWAKVHNRGTTLENNATIKFYWANPSTLVTRSTAILIGQSFASLAPGETKEVLCLTPWVPSWVNDGHECVLCEVFSQADPLPPHNENDSFNVRNDRHVAQRNLGILMASSSTGMAVYPFGAGNAANMATNELRLSAKRVPLHGLKKSEIFSGKRQIPEEMPDVREFGIVHYRPGQQVSDVGRPELILKVKPGTAVGMALIVRMPKNLRDGDGALFVVEQSDGNQVIGGIGVLIMPEGTHPTEEPHGRRK